MPWMTQEKENGLKRAGGEEQKEKKKDSEEDGYE